MKSSARLFSGCKPPWRILFFGTDEFALKPLEKLLECRNKGHLVKSLEVVCPAEKQKSKNGGSSSKTMAVRQYASHHGIYIYDWHRKMGLSEKLPAGSYDVGVVVSFGYLIPSSVLTLFQCGAFNIHPSLLPRWRGAAPIAHTLLNGDKRTGVSIISLSKNKFDVGNILLQEEYQIPHQIKFEELYRDLSQLSARMLIDVLGDFLKYQDNAKPQSDKGATHAPKITKDMGFVDWDNHTCQQIERLWRSLSTTVGLHTSWEGKLVKLITMNTWVYEIDVEDYAAGHVVYDDVIGVLFIRCQDGWVGFSELQFQCRNVITALDFANSYLVDKLRTPRAKTKRNFETLKV